MPTKMRNLLKLGSLSAALSLVATETVFENAAAQVIYKDVVIVGGGASGSHAAVRLRQDLGLSVVVVENQDKLGGLVDTFIDPATGNPYEIGVQNFIDVGNASNFFHRMNVSTTAPSRAPLTSRFVDFTTELAVANYTTPSNTDLTAAFQIYLAVCEQYENMMLPGYWNFPPPQRIPEDLMMPFGNFTRKYNISAAVSQIFETTGFDIFNMMQGLTFYVIRAFGAQMAASSWAK